ncbi:MAG: NAD-dependent DNA ligase LigA [Bacteroidales bacterium]
MDKTTARARVSELISEINEHNYRYYILNSPVIDDVRYDMLVKELEALETQYPDLVQPDSPTQRVGSDLTKEFISVVHKYPMLSLSNTYSKEELFDFYNRVQKAISANVEFVSELKFDGVAIGLTYINGRLVRAVTRGDGIQGDDVTANAKTIRSIPLQLRGNNYPSEFEIRGEVFLTRHQFEILNSLREEEGDQPFANPRNAAAGSLKMQDPAAVDKRGLDCYFYDILGDNLSYNTHYENLQAAKEWGLHIPEYMVRCKTIEDVWSYIADWETQRTLLPFDIDGVVVKVNSYEQRQALGFTAKSPRWAIAYKYQAQQAATILQTVDFQVGRTGIITPVANLKPVLLAGTVVKRASLHNADIISKLDVRLGDTVFVEKGGEIIPKITGVDFSLRPTHSEPLGFISHCPECGTALVRNEGEAGHFCPNEDGCPPQIKGRLEHFISRRAMNIESLGEGKIELLYEKGLIKNAADLYDLKYDDLLGLEKTITPEEGGKERKVSFREKTVENILDALATSRSVPFHSVLYALGIRHVGETIAKKLSISFGNLDALITASTEQLTQIPDIGDRIANSIRDYFSKPEHLQMISRLKEHGLQFSTNIEQEAVSTLLDGRTFVVSGVFSGYSRDGIKQAIVKNGGRVVGSISSKTNFVIAGENMGPEKKKKAEELGIPIIDEAQFNAMINA